MKRRQGPFLRLPNCESGSTAAEFAIIALPMVLLILGIIEFGRGLYLYNRISFAVDRGVRIGITHPEATDQQLTDEVLAEFLAPGAASGPGTLSEVRPTVEITFVDVPSGLDFKILSARMLFKPLIPNLLEKQFTLSVTRRIPKIS